jgi:hypothetical protein
MNAVKHFKFEERGNGAGSLTVGEYVRHLAGHIRKLSTPQS